MHKILDRQIKKFFSNVETLPENEKEFLETISTTYEHFDEDRSLLERSLGLSSKELTEINTKLKEEIGKVNAQAVKLEENSIKDEAILSSIGDGMIVIDQEGRITVMNNQAEFMLGWKFADWQGQAMADLLLMEDKNGHRLSEAEQPMRLALNSGKKVFSRSGYYIRKDQTKFPVAVTASPIILKKEIMGTILIFRDITIEVDIDKVKTEFVSLASHQIRTPLSTIRWYIEMLLAGDAGALNDKQRKYLEEVYSSNRRMIELVNALLDVSRLELGTFVVEPEPINLAEIAESVLKELTPLIKNNQLTIIKEYDPALPLINADSKLMRMIFQNLISNAAKYTLQGGEISITIKRQGNIVAMEIADNGYGIPPHQQGQVFTKLFRADNIKEKNSEGTGLGLYIVKSIIDYAGGTIRFESAENQGTTFYIALPLEGMVKKEGSKTLTQFH